MNYRKINHQQENTFIICKQLNGPVLKSLKPSCLSRNQKKNWLGRARPGPKLCISFQAGLGLEPKFQFLFRVRPRLYPCGPGRAGPGLKNPASSDLYHIFICLKVIFINQRTESEDPPLIAFR